MNAYSNDIALLDDDMPGMKQIILAIELHSRACYTLKHFNSGVNKSGLQRFINVTCQKFEH